MYIFVICATILGAGKLSVKIPIKVGYVCPRAHYEETEECVPLTSRPVIHPSHNESCVPFTSRPVIHPSDNEPGAPLTMSTEFNASNPFLHQPAVFPLVPHPGLRNALPAQPGVVPLAPYPAASNPLSYQSGVVPTEPPLMASIYDPPPPYSSQPDLTDPHLQ